MSRDRPRNESPWYCPACRSWNGWMLDRCLECKRSRPRLPLRYDDVPFDDSRQVDRSDRIKGKIRSLREWAAKGGTNRTVVPDED